jgi:phosphodiester glycosidase
MHSPARLLPILAGACVLQLVLAAQPAAPQLELGPSREIAPGVVLYHVTDPAHLNPPAPVSIWLLRLDPRHADIRAALANDEIVDTETVPAMAQRHDALAAVNAGFFLLPSGDPAGIYKLNGQLVSDTRRPRGAVGIIRDGPISRFIFGRVSASMQLRVSRRSRPDMKVEIAGVDTTRQLGKLMLFTPAYHAHTDTAAGGLEWVLEGNPLRVRDRPVPDGKTPIPRNGFVLSFGGSRPPPPLSTLRPGSRVQLETLYMPLDGAAEDWVAAADIVGGAGLLVHDGRLVLDWTVEKFNAGFAEARHPRTIIGTHPDGSVWLVTVDGRQPALSAGMTLIEVRELVRRLGLTNALNLDGGGSTTMWAGGRTVNSPSDAAGPRKVSDALLIMRRGPGKP